MSEVASPSDQEILERIAEWIVERRMAVPAILFLESHRPLSFVGAQAMIFASPVVGFFEPFFRTIAGPGFGHDLYRRFAVMMEDREKFEDLVVAIERANQTRQDRDREEKRRRRELKREVKARRKALRRQKAGRDHA